MGRSGDIVPISSRRHPPTLVPHKGTLLDSTAGRRASTARSLGPILFVGVITLIAGLAVGQWRSATSLRDIPEVVRVAQYRRALADAEETCTRPEAAEGPLRGHCVDQARFLILFPECDAHCRSVVEAILPRARR